MKDREAKSRAREDKRGWLEQMESETDTYAKNGRTKELYRTAKKNTRGGIKLLQLRTRGVRQ